MPRTAHHSKSVVFICSDFDHADIAQACLNELTKKAKNANPFSFPDQGYLRHPLNREEETDRLQEVRIIIFVTLSISRA